jgi:Flp pilus assembly protein TadD/cell division septation protein DedD
MNFKLYLVFGAASLLAACNPQATSMPATTDAPGSPSTLNVADAAIAGGDPTMALSVSQSVLANDPHNVDALIHEGDAFYALGRCPAAEAAYNLALQYDAKSSPAETGLGRCLIKTDPAGAEQALVLAVQDDPGNAAAFNDLGIARDLQGKFAGAVDPYEKALAAQPGMIAAETNLGLSLALSGQGQEALQYLGPLATGQGATPKIREDYAAALVATGQVDEARHVLSIDLPPDDVEKALDGFNAIIANAQPPLPSGTQAQPATMAQVQTASVAAAPLTPSAAPAAAAPPAASAPASAASAPASSTPTSSDPDAAYTGPSPIPGAISSSMPDLTSPPADISPSAPPPAGSAAKPLPPKLVVTAAAASPPAAATPPPADSSAAGSGTYEVQLGALPSQDAAQHMWDRLSGANPSLFGDKSPDIQMASVNGKTFYRLRTGAFATKAGAAKFCGEVSAAGSVCTLANF